VKNEWFAALLLTYLAWKGVLDAALKSVEYEPLPKTGPLHFEVKTCT